MNFLLGIVAAESRAAAPTPGPLLWQPLAEVTEAHTIEITELRHRSGLCVGFGGETQRNPGRGIKRRRGWQIFDLDLSEDHGVLSLEFDAML